MEDTELRLRCIENAGRYCLWTQAKPEELVEAAEKLYNFVTGKAKSKTIDNFR